MQICISRYSWKPALKFLSCIICFLVFLIKCSALCAFSGRQSLCTPGATLLSFSGVRKVRWSPSSASWLCMDRRYWRPSLGNGSPGGSKSCCRFSFPLLSMESDERQKHKNTTNPIDHRNSTTTLLYERFNGMDMIDWTEHRGKEHNTKTHNTCSFFPFSLSLSLCLFV